MHIRWSRADSDRAESQQPCAAGMPQPPLVCRTNRAAETGLSPHPASNSCGNTEAAPEVLPSFETPLARLLRMRMEKYSGTANYPLMVRSGHRPRLEPWPQSPDATAPLRRRRPSPADRLFSNSCAQFVFAAALAGAAVVTNSVASSIACPSGVGMVTR
jgi:hypothetical protein